MRDLLERIDAQHPNLIVKFGGHAMAAGLTIHQDNFDTFRQIFDEQINQLVEPDELQGVLYTDGELRADEFNLDTVHLLQQSGPWGQHFPEPTFEGEFQILQQRLVGGKHLKMLVQNRYGMLIDAIWFNIDVRNYPDLSIKKAQLIYRLEINEYRAKRSLQLLIDGMVIL